MIYYVLVDPNKAKVSLSLYFTTYKDALEYAQSVQEYNPKIVEYNTNRDYTMMYNNILSIIN